MRVMCLNYLSIELTTHRAKNGILGISNHIRESVEKTDKIKIRKWCDENVILLKKDRNGMISF